MPKKYDLIPEVDNLSDMSEIIAAGDMQVGNMSFMTMRALLMVGGRLIGLICAGILVYKFIFARTNDAWWLITLTWIASIFWGWLVLRLLIRFYIQIRLQNPEYDWRPAGTHIMLRSDQAVFEGQQTFHCPHCSKLQHIYKIRLTRLHGGYVGYMPTLLDPIAPTSIVYHRHLRIPVTCPTTNKIFQGTFTIDQCSKDAILRAEAVGTLA